MAICNNKKISMMNILNYVKSNWDNIDTNIANDYDVYSYSSINNIKDKSIVFFKNTIAIDVKNFEEKNITLICESDERLVNTKVNYIFTDRPRDVFFSIVDNFFVGKETKSISKKATILTKNIGDNLYLGDYSYIDKDVIIGNNVTIHNNVSIICPTEIGDNTVIFPGVVVGTDGFGIYKDKVGIPHQIPHIGGVKIGKNVVIGANTCIDRATIDYTIIEDNVKIDNLCHIAHNVHIKENTCITVGTLFGGSSYIKENNYFAPGSIIMNGITIGKNSFVGMGSVVTKDIEDKIVVAGVPAKKIRDNK